MATPHISAEKGDFAKTVLMPGDPLRAKFIAETFLTDAVEVNHTRGILGYTGLYKGKRVSVMASGMGCPSIGIYSHELFNFYDVENIIRIGSAGALSERLKVRDIVAGIGSNTTSSYAEQYHMPGTLAPQRIIRFFPQRWTARRQGKLKCTLAICSAPMRSIMRAAWRKPFPGRKWVRLRWKWNRPHCIWRRQGQANAR